MLPKLLCPFELLEGMAEYYSAELSQKVKRGMRESCLKGNAAGIQPIYGYCIVDKKYQVVPSEAEVVRKLFNDYVNGTSIKDLLAWVNESGIKTHKGKSFSFGRLSEMLRNQKYIGKCSYGGEVYDNIIMPIVDETVFWRAQEMLAANVHKSGRSRAGEKFILSGKLVCAECGSLMIGESGTCRNGDIHYFYKCRRKKEGTHKCGSSAVPKQAIEDSVYKIIMQAMTDESFLRRVAEQAVKIYNRQLKEQPELKILRKQLAETDEMLDNITMAICKGIFNEHTQSKMVELTNLKNDLIAKISEEESKTVKPLQVETIMSYFRSCALAIKCAEDPNNLEKRKNLFDSCIKEIIFDGGKYLIILKTTDYPEYTGDESEKEKSRTECDEFRARFETLRFGEPFVNYPNTIYPVKEGFGFVILFN